MKGFVPTPPHIVDSMVAKLFRDRYPRAGDTLLDPGCGTGTFIQGVVRWCSAQGSALPQIVGVESDPKLLEEARNFVGAIDRVTLLHEDFLLTHAGRYDFIVGNPPYVPITGLTDAERNEYRKRYSTARGRFDLYQLFFEQALRLLKPEGRLVFITPEKFLYVQTAAELRRGLAKASIEEIEFVDEAAFGDLVTYPTVTSISARPSDSETKVTLRNGTTRAVHLDSHGSSWLPQIHGGSASGEGPLLADAFERISCGVATGADGVFVVDHTTLDPALRRFASPTIAGRSITPGAVLEARQSMLIPYRDDGTLMEESALGELGDYLREPKRREQLMRRTCVARKPWYAFHENPPLRDIRKPKILCKDIGARPWFVVDETGEIVPRHSVYYLVPRDPAAIHDLCEYLNSVEAADWLMSHCQRAANGFLRLQSHVLKRLPLPEHLLATTQLSLV